MSGELVLSSDGSLGLKGGALAIIGPGGDDCCCPGGCCPGILIPSESAAIPPTVGSILLVEIIADTTGCFMVGSTMTMSDEIANTIWVSESFFGYFNWKPLTLSCGFNDQGEETLSLGWIQGLFCPSIDTAPPGSPYRWSELSGQCRPFEWVYSYEIDEVDPLGLNPGCNCEGENPIPGTVQGTVTIRVTLA